MKILKQICIILGICLVAEGISMVISIPIPASVIAIVILALLLSFKVLREKQIRETSDFFLSNMAIVFLPVSVATIDELGILKGNLIAFLTICLISLICTFFGAYFTVCIVEKLISKKGGEENE